MKYNLKPRTFDLKLWRQNYSLSTRQVGEILKCDASYVSRLENGFYVAKPETAKDIFKRLEKYEEKVKPQILTNFSSLIDLLAN